jgi:hypothetical protein
MEFTINGKTYEGAKYDFNTHCEFDALGVNALSLSANPLPVLRAYLSICSGMDLITCGKELEQHIVGGGNLAEMITLLAKEINNSDFFMAITKSQKTEEKTKRTKDTKKSA